MKGRLFGNKKGPQPSVEINQPYLQQQQQAPQVIAADPRIQPAQYQRIDPSQQPIAQPDPQQQQQAQQQQQPPQQVRLVRSPSHPNHPNNQPRRTAAQPPNSEINTNVSTGYINPPRQQGVDEYQRQENRHSAYLPGQQSHPPEEHKKRGIRDRLGLTSSKDGRHDQVGGVGRKLSVRGKGSPNPDIEGRQQWARQSNSSQLLLSPTEEDEDSQQARFNNPQFGRQQVLVKDGELVQGYPPPQGQQQYYPPPGEIQQQFHQGYRAQNTSSSEQVYLSPEQQLQLQQQQEGQFGQYPEQHLQQAPQQFHSQQQHYPPPQGLGGQTQAHPTAPPPGYVFDQQHSVQPSQPSPEEGPQFALQPQSPEGQTSAVDIHQPRATRPVTGQQEGVFLQAPPSATQVQSPPSPFAGQEAQNVQTDLQSAPQQPPSPSQQSAPSPMPPPSRSGGNIRQPDGKSMHSSSRESSMTASHPQGPGGQSTGKQTFPANVVPSGAQGQPYRGVPGGPQAPPPAEGDHGRATPSDRGPGDFTEEEAAHYHQLMKDHKELKEKYQKVKKYYFEKESQVHQLQNTLANQRLSASKTSLDDSEYSARFSRLDGLISQLSFSIRKSWTSIPEWLHRAVNKDAITTGKQEMTAVGRAFISCWLYREVFERIFHPDLDPELSFQLKTILTNLRHFAPPCNSGEEEEALASKLASWRMSTLEGLADALRAPAAQQHRQDLLQHLNGKLIADISDFLIDPAPPDLAGGVYMIVELAANICAHLHGESREVAIEYYPPLCPISPEIMKLEQGIPQLISPIAGGATGPGAIDDDNDSAKDAPGPDDLEQPMPPPKDEPKGRRGMLANLMGTNTAKPPGQPPIQQTQKPGSAGSAGKQNGAAAGGRETPSNREERVRLAVGLGVVIRNRSVLVRAPVYTTLV
ncbi:hypothetical protein BT63DRAFT_410556 [Microthyrium microscopicum]|uniref:Uncharacterized protein n=1 Tax=Microthyrium microscopicum TaxID=703497 RepID=A0A6A6UPC0_9PEZI|nr:hypothetical protein BT63DRAFT_410556 [Microthyrium microscopicum]